VVSEWVHEPAALAALMPEGFCLGVATCALQIEGAIAEGGRGPSSWDVFMRQGGRILDRSTAAVASDHSHRMPEDLTLLRRLGVDSYRFSLSWPRIQPPGKGPALRAGLDFYDRLLDGLLAAGILPTATLYHWDTPQPLQEAGGWLDRDTAHRFADYAYLAGEAFGDRVDKWVTVDAPATLTLNGYALGTHAPGTALLLDALPAAHHQLLGHGLAVQALRAAGVRGGVGIVGVHSPVEAASDRPDDVRGAALFDLVHNRMCADAVLLGRYPRFPDELRAAALVEAIEAGDLVTISQPLDFYGVGYEAPIRIRAGASAADGSTGGGLPFRLAPWPELPRTGAGRPIAPSRLALVLSELAERYGDALPPVYLTDLGASFPDTVAVDGTVDDPRRAEYLAEHLAAALSAPGVELRGCFVRSLLDGWEWTAGFTQRFGLVHVDFATQDRTPKASYRWLQNLLAAR
jgi:beta-glucosidase